jgi:hypothetical protein
MPIGGATPGAGPPKRAAHPFGCDVERDDYQTGSDASATRNEVDIAATTRMISPSDHTDAKNASLPPRPTPAQSKSISQPSKTTLYCTSFQRSDASPAEGGSDRRQRCPLRGDLRSAGSPMAPNRTERKPSSDQDGSQDEGEQKPLGSGVRKPCLPPWSGGVALVRVRRTSG